MTQSVFFFGNGRAEATKDDRDLLGGKGANLAEMTNAGLPVPPGFTIPTSVCNEYYELGGQAPAALWDEALAALARSRLSPATPSATPRTRCWSRCVPARSSRCPA